MKIGFWMTVAVGLMLCFACSSGEDESASTCPRSALSCSDAQGTWCCQEGTTCAPSHGACEPMCPASTPVKCEMTNLAVGCCPANTTCGPNSTCVPESAQGGVGGGQSGGNAGGGSGGKASTCSPAQQCGASCCGSGEACNGVSDAQQCAKTCASAADCPGQACAPSVTAGQPIGPYVCVPNDGAAYHGCMGLLTSCGDGYCCFADGNANQFCAKPCTGTNLSECGLASCNMYNGDNTTCQGTLGCGPDPN